jgi:hypothetical protein
VASNAFLSLYTKRSYITERLTNCLANTDYSIGAVPLIRVPSYGARQDIERGCGDLAVAKFPSLVRNRSGSLSLRSSVVHVGMDVG